MAELEMLSERVLLLGKLLTELERMSAERLQNVLPGVLPDDAGGAEEGDNAVMECSPLAARLLRVRRGVESAIGQVEAVGKVLESVEC